MPQNATCCCPHHARWGHTDGELRIANKKEKEYCEVDPDGRRKDRKRYICVFCRSRIVIEVRATNKKVRMRENLALFLNQTRRSATVS